MINREDAERMACQYATERIKQRILYVESQNTERLTNHKKAHKISLGPIEPGYCVDCGKPRGLWESISEECNPD